MVACVLRLSANAIGGTWPPSPVRCAACFNLRCAERRSCGSAASEINIDQRSWGDRGQRAVAVDEKPKAFAIRLSRPFAVLWLAARVVSNQIRRTQVPARRIVEGLLITRLATL